jgi:phospholipid/cholesterol/gamma-HCH transport system permease protein
MTMLTAYQSTAHVGSKVFQGIAGFGQFVVFVFITARWIFSSPGRWCRWRQLRPQFYAVGVASIPVVAITGGFIGMILAMESFNQFQAFGLEGRLGGIINVSVVKQIGPVLAAVMVAGRVGGALAAELGTMRVTEQLDALRSMASDPVLHLVVPRVIACMIMTPLLTIYSDLLGVWGGHLITVGFNGVPPTDYWSFTEYFVGWWEPTTGLIKAVFFGLSIGLISCYKGFNCRPGAAGVGRATTDAFVVSFLAIIIINFVLAGFLNTIDMLYITQGTQNPLG